MKFQTLRGPRVIVPTRPASSAGRPASRASSALQPRLDAGVPRLRVGFTLIELLVVIAIIAILVSLTTAAVQRVRVGALQTKNGHRMQKTAEAISAARAPRDKGGLALYFIPSVGPGTDFPNGFPLKRTYNVGGNADDAAAVDYFTSGGGFPNLDSTNTGFSGTDAMLDSNQLLLFLLTGGVSNNFSGHSNNPKRPFSPPSGGDSRRGPYLEIQNSSSEPMTATAPNGQAWLLDVYGTPYAYFAPRKNKAGMYGPQNFQGLAPYMSGGKFVNDNSFQIVSAGRDKQFGTGTTLPGTGLDADNEANFSRVLLSGGINN